MRRRWHRRLVCWLYLVRCSDGTLYVGHTDDLETRIARHNKGFASSYTARRCPVALVYSEKYHTRLAAIERERQLKRWSGQKKEALVRGDLGRLRTLARRRT